MTDNTEILQSSAVFGAEEQARLAALLDDGARNGAGMRIDELQGFVLARISGPDSFDPDAMLPEITGSDAAGADGAEVAVLTRMMADGLCRQMDGGHLPELIVQDDEAGRPDFYTWCNAFIYGLDTAPTDRLAGDDDNRLSELLYPVFLLGGLYDGDDTALSEAEYGKRLHFYRRLPQVLLQFYRYWAVMKKRPATVRATEKTGRNAPCPCGSGKKFKQCCGRG